jgi:GWxTD domain-containing protein
MSRDRILLSVALSFATLTIALLAQSTNENPPAQAAGPKQVAGKSDETDPLKRPLTEKQKQKNVKANRRELSAADEDWLKHQVRYIISPEEEQAFLALSNEEERATFIEHFWTMRDPTPDTPENEFRDEHYRRLAYADQHFAAGIPGWKTDRGMIYIKYGPPDEIEAHPSGGLYQRPIEEGGGAITTLPFEIWRYRHLENIGENVMIEFLDSCQCGEYRMTVDREAKKAFNHTPLGNELPDALQQERQRSKEFDDLEVNAKLQQNPSVKWGDRPDVRSIIRYNLLPFDMRVDFIKASLDKVLVPVTIQVENRDITFEDEKGVAHGIVNIAGHVYNMTGEVVQAFEDAVALDIPDDLLEKIRQNRSLYWKAFPLPAGRYRMDLVLKDVKGDRMGALTKSFIVPAYGDDKLAASSLILADLMEKVPSSSVGAGNFVIDDTKVRPRVATADGKPASFRRDQKMNVWMQVYNLGLDGQSNKPSATIEYDVVDAATNAPVLHMEDSTAAMGNASDKITLKQSVPLEKMPPGAYRLTIKVNDQVSRQKISPSVNFVVE